MREIKQYKCDKCGFISDTNSEKCPACEHDGESVWTQPCLIKEIMKQYKIRGEPIPPIAISCTCPKCSPK